MSIVSSTSGRTSTDANDVCRRAVESNGLIRTRRWTPGLAAEIAVGVLALDVDGRLLDAGRAAVLAVGDLGLEAFGLGPHQVHPQEHLGPVAGLGARRRRRGSSRRRCSGRSARRASSGTRTPRSRPRPARRPSRISSSNSSSSASSASSIEASRLSAWRTRASNGLRTAFSVFSSWMIVLGLLLVVPEGRAVHLLLERVAARLLFAQVKESLEDGRSARSRSWPSVSVRRP